jgi:hypothetical protein
VIVIITGALEGGREFPLGMDRIDGVSCWPGGQVELFLRDSEHWERNAQGRVGRTPGAMSGASSVVLAPSQRRLRHVQCICFRNVAVRGVGLTGPTDTASATASPTGSVSLAARRRGATMTARMRRGTVTFKAPEEPNADLDASLESVPLPTTFFTLSSLEPVAEFYRSEAVASTAHPTFAPLPSDAREYQLPRVLVSLYAVPSASPSVVVADSSASIDISTCTVCYRFEMDLRRVHFEGKSLTNGIRYDVDPTGAPRVVALLKCEDGVFRVGETGARRRTTAKSADPLNTGSSVLPPGVASREAAARGESDEDTWDVVDADVARQEEHRQLGRVVQVTSSDVLALTAASSTLAASRRLVLQDTHRARELISEAFEQAKPEASRIAKSALLDASARQLAAEQQRADARVESLKREIAAKRELIATRRAAVAASRELAASPTGRTGPESAGDGLLNQRRSTASSGTATPAMLSQRQKEVAQQLRVLVGIEADQPDTRTTLMGFAIPEDPATEQDNIALGIMAQVFVAYCAVHEHQPLYPVQLNGARSTISTIPDDDMRFPLYAVTKADKQGFVQAARFMRTNVIVAANAIHGQRQAEGLPLAMAMRKLLCNS